MNDLEEQICIDLNERFDKIECLAQQQLNMLTDIGGNVINIVSAL